MSAQFTPSDVLTIYRVMLRRVKEYEGYQSTPNFPIAQENLDEEIALCQSVIEKIEEAYPDLAAARRKYVP